MPIAHELAFESEQTAQVRIKNCETSVYILISTLLFWYWVIKGKQEILSQKSSKKIHYYVFVGSLLGIWGLFYIGFNKVLFFIPESWGGINEDGDFISTRNAFAGLMAMLSTFFLHLTPSKFAIFFRRKLFQSKEIMDAQKALNQAATLIGNPDVSLVKGEIEKVIIQHPDDIVNAIKSGISPLQWATSALANVAGDMLETGKYHIYRGFLNPAGPGNSLLKIYDTAIDHLVQMGAVDSMSANTEKKALRDNLKTVG
jgi:hypothetical protein